VDERGGREGGRESLAHKRTRASRQIQGCPPLLASFILTNCAALAEVKALMRLDRPISKRMELLARLSMR